MAVDKIDILIAAKVDAAIKNLESVNKSQKKIEKTQEGFFSSAKMGWLKFAGIVGTAAIAIKKAFNFVGEFARFQQSTQAMEQQFGVSADKVLAKLREVSAGTISNAGLVEAANRSMALNVTKDLDQMAKLLEIARVRGRAMGIDTTQAFNDIVTGIGRQSPLILDNLGIITKGWAEEAKAAGKAFDTQFILNKVMQDGQAILNKTGKLVRTTAEDMDALGASIDNAKIAIGKGLSVGFSPLLKKIAELTSETSQWMSFMRQAPLAFNMLNLAIQRGIKFFGLFGEAVGKALRGDLIGGIKEARVEIAKVNKTFNEDVKKAVTEWTVAELERLNAVKANRKAESAAISVMLNDVVKKTKKAKQKEVDITREAAREALDIQRAGFAFIDQLRQNQFDKRTAQLEEERARELEALQISLDDTNIYTEQLEEIRQSELQTQLERLEEERQAALRTGNAKLAEERRLEIEKIKLSENEKKRSKEIADASVAAEKSKADREAEINAEYDKKEGEAKAKIARADKAWAIVQAGINTAVAAAKVSFSRILTTLTLIRGGIQVAAITAQPIPKFAQGGRPNPNEPSIVGERGPEIFVPDRAGTVIPNEVSNISNQDMSKKEFHFHGIQDLSQARNELLRTEGEDAF